MSKQVKILFPGAINQQNITGSYLRTFNIAKLASSEFETYIYGISKNKDFESENGEIHIIHEKKYNNYSEKLKHFSKALLSDNYSLMKSNKAFNNINIKTTVFQMEGPLTYNLLKKNNIDNYVLNEHDVNWEFSEFPSFNVKDKIYRKFASKRDKKLEIQALLNASHIITCSDRDKDIILNEIPEVESKITVIPNCVNLEEYINLNNNKKSNSKNHLKVLFMGLLSYPPNEDAVRNICNIIAPNLENDVEFIIIGNNPPKIKNKPKNVKFLGYVKDLKPHILKSDICIAPLKFGSGTRLKILEYMVMGKPVISTEKGAEGIDYTHDKNIIIENNLEHFSEKIKELFDDTKREKLGNNALKLIKSRYDWKIYKKDLLNLYNEVLDES